MAPTRILVVDDDPLVSETLTEILKLHGFDVTAAANVPEALRLIALTSFDVLLSDLHMPHAGDGLTVVSAMRHANPEAVTLLFSAFPEMNAAVEAILLQADEILVKPTDVNALIEVIRLRLATGPARGRVVESVAAILERSSVEIIDDWFRRVEGEKLLTSVAMTREERCSHLPQVFRDLVHRLRSFKKLGTKEMKSASAVEHGIERRRRGYSAPMLVEESRQLQVSIFSALQDNLASIDFSVVLSGVMTIADEIDSQLSQGMASYVAESLTEALSA